MSIVRKAISDVKKAIPAPILKEAFLNNDYFRSNSLSSLDDRIYIDVYKGFVADHLNMTGGETIAVPLADCEVTPIDFNAMTIKLSPTSTNGKGIVSVLSINYFKDNTSYYHYLNSVSGNDLLRAGQSAINRNSGIPLVSSSNIRILSNDMLMVRGVTRIPSNGFITCTVENDDDLNNISPRSYPAFLELFTYAVKAHCYNELIIDVDQARLSGGKELGVFKEKLDEYADAWELYNTYLKEKWAEVAFHNDDVRRKEWNKIISVI